MVSSESNYLTYRVISAVREKLEKSFGPRRPIVGEPLTWDEEYPIEWREPGLNLAELAVLRWIKGTPTKDLAARYGKSECAMKNYYHEMRANQFRVPGLSDDERSQIMRLSKVSNFVGRPKTRRTTG